MKKWIVFLVLLTSGFIAFQQGWLEPLSEQTKRFSRDKEPAPEPRDVNVGAHGVAMPDTAAPNRVETTGEPPPPPPRPEGPPTGRLRARCPACDGQGRYLFEGERRMARTLACQVCGGRGHRDIFVPPGGRVCGLCNGMGRRHEMLDTGRMRTSACPQCVGRGVLGR